MDSDFNEVALEKIVSQALHELASKRDTIFSFGETEILKALPNILSNYVQHHTDTQRIMDEIRQHIQSYIGLNLEQRLRRLHQLHTAVINCSVCPNMKHDAQPALYNFKDPDVVFLSQSPLMKQDEILFDAIKQAGYSSSRICITSITKCNTDEYRNPSASEVVSCSNRFLFNEIQLMKPKLIVCLGTISSSVLIGEEIKATNARGNVYWIGNWPILISLSPRQASFRQEVRDDFYADIQKSFNMIYGATHNLQTQHNESESTSYDQS